MLRVAGWPDDAASQDRLPHPHRHVMMAGRAAVWRRRPAQNGPPGGFSGTKGRGRPLEATPRVNTPDFPDFFGYRVAPIFLAPAAPSVAHELGHVLIKSRLMTAT